VGSKVRTNCGASRRQESRHRETPTKLEALEEHKPPPRQFITQNSYNFHQPTMARRSSKNSRFQTM